MGKDAKAQAKHAQKNLKQMLPGFGGKEKKLSYPNKGYSRVT